MWGAIIALGGAATVHTHKDSFYSSKTARMILGFTRGRLDALGENAVALHADYIRHPIRANQNFANLSQGKKHTRGEEPRA